MKSGTSCFYYWIWSRTFSRNDVQSFKKIYRWKSGNKKWVTLNCFMF